MTPQNFSKPSLGPAQQIGLLKSRGMTFVDEPAAELLLGNINYYRLRAYWHPFEQPHPTLSHHFPSPITFESVLSLYRFDRKFRLLVLDAVERLEIAVKTKWAFELSQYDGPFAHEERRNFKDKQLHRFGLRHLEQAYRDSQEDFALHHLQAYPTLKTPPTWVSCELMSFGQVSRWLSNTKPAKVRKKISRHFGFEPAFFETYLHLSTVVRNICAHHSRLWNRQIPSAIPIPTRTKFDATLLTTHPQGRHKIYNFLAVMGFVLARISPGESWADRLTRFLKKDVTRLNHMGFPAGWERAFT